ncbi:hypothetical protein BASA50_001873 [Batrachochytrium salamandrivorans]|uniref:Uncharacterized protein n=1 Tax=Batrachochytrium salamandrivorans TaxID=1357716 RepID=A0ABQ8FMW9_9FUNG|nr:hypothetical protein BASA50_001873 [Batrachochytrium salamandrivorans]
MFAFWIRNAPSQLGNARQLGYVVYISALLTLIVMVGGFSGISTVTTEFFVESIVVLFGLVTIYGFLVAAPLFGAVTGYVSKTLPGIQGFGTSRDNSGTTSAITSVSQNNAGQPAARGMRGRKRVTVTLVLDGLNLLLCVGGSDDQTTEFNIANLISVEVLEKHPTESVPNCLILKQVTQTHILQLKSYAQVYTLAGELAKKMIPEDSEEQRMTLQNTDRVLKSVVLVTANDMMQTPLSDRKKVAANGVKPLPKKSDVDFEDDY